MTVQLRPGVAFPDWSVVSSPSARATLIAMLDAAWDRRAWQDYTAAEDAVRRTILELYRDLGRAPSRQEIAIRSSMRSERIAKLLERLAARDLIVLDGEAIVGAYPFTDEPTEHRLRIGERTLFAMCAIDALGVGAMYREDVEIVSRCRQCGAPIEITTGEQGRALERTAPPESVVLAAISYRGCAATSLCTTIAFFCGDAHSSAWRSRERFERPSFRLSIAEALEVGQAIFGPVLTPSVCEDRLETTS